MILRKIFVAVIVILLIALGVWIIVKSMTSEETRIRREIAEMVEAVHKKNALAFRGHLSEDFSCHMAENRDELFALMKFGFQQDVDVRVRIHSMNITLTGDDTAEVAVMVTVTAVTESGRRAIREWGRETERLMVRFRKEDGNWRVLRAEPFEPEFE